MKRAGRTRRKHIASSIFSSFFRGIHVDIVGLVMALFMFYGIISFLDDLGLFREVLRDVFNCQLVVIHSGK